MYVTALSTALLSGAVAGVPNFALILAAALAGFYLLGIDPAVVIIELYRIADTPLLMALPLFTLAGYLLSESDSTARLVRLGRAAVGWLPGGIGAMVLLVSALFTAFTGASGVTIVALGALLLPALSDAGFSRRDSLGLITVSGSLGLLLPPSVPLILYGIVALQLDLGVDMELRDLFLGGIAPTALMLALLLAYTSWVGRQRRQPRPHFDGRELAAALWAARWELPLPVIVLAGIYGGLFALSETAAVTCAYVLLVKLLTGELGPRQLMAVSRQAMVAVGGIILILGAALGFTNVLIDAQVPALLFDWISAHVDSKLTFLLLLNLFLLGLGAILDIYAAIVLVVPLVLPIALNYGVHPVHLGIIFLANLQIGYFTPPVGLNLFIASYRFQESILTLYRATLPFMLVLLLALGLITYLPALSLWLIE